VTHGPPRFSEHNEYNLDANEKGEHLGCAKLAGAVRRGPNALESASGIGRNEMLFVNAAVEGGGSTWLVDLDVRR
jgi:hypothetical protein